MAPEVTGRKRATKVKKHANAQKRKRADVDAEKLQEAVSALDRKATYTTFADLPLSDATVAGLKAAHFSTLTDIQAKAIVLGLQGYDILGAAKTGSGKTLAFLVPVLENLYRAQCVGSDAGLSAMIISPTRELAAQIFEVLKKVGGKGHLFAAGLVIGGKSLREEQDALARMNIVVCTPGRILQHLSGTAGFNVDNLNMLVLDEADRIMDMGFKKEVDSIIEYLPQDRQTLLFSATQTKRVSDLSRLALKYPEYISVHEAASSSTPHTLQQNYVITPLPEKLDILWSFLQSSKKSKILVFLSSGKQVRFVYEAFRQMQPGIPLLHLHGRQKQNARMEITQRFAQAKYSCLFATDVVARGLDFPAVDWVIQLDCPEDADTYIHRVGRTARYEKSGRAVLLLDPNEEEGMLSRLEQKKVPIERINIRAKKQQSIKKQLQKMCYQDPALNYLGRTAFISYVKSLKTQKDRDIFKFDEYPFAEYAESLGLHGAPSIKFFKGDAEEAKRRKNAPRAERANFVAERDESGTGNDPGLEVGKTRSTVRTRYDRMFERQNQDILAEHYTSKLKNKVIDDGSLDQANEFETVDNDDLFDAKRRLPVEDVSDSDNETESITVGLDRNDALGAREVHIPGAKQPLVLDSNRKEKLLKSKKKLLKLKDTGHKLVFDDEGDAHEIYELDDENDFKARGDATDQRQRFVDNEQQRVRDADMDDKLMVKEKRKAKREKRRERERAEVEADEGQETGGPAVEADEDAMANFLADAENTPEESDGNLSEDGTKHKKQKNWFEEERPRKKQPKERHIETLDDLEAEASRLLA